MEGGQAVLPIGFQSAWPPPSTASCLSGHCPVAWSSRPEFCSDGLTASLLGPLLPGNPHLKYTDPDMGSGTKGLLRPSQLPLWGKVAMEKSRGCSIQPTNLIWLGIFWVYVMRGKKVVGEICFWSILGVCWMNLPSLLSTSFRIDHTGSRIDWTQQNILETPWT